MAKTVADMLVERLIDWGVDTIFGFPGDGINGIFEALRTNQEKIKFNPSRVFRSSERFQPLPDKHSSNGLQNESGRTPVTVR